jgi:sialic acid synthase SpsE
MIVCEIGINHFGDIKYAKKYVDKIIEMKSDAISFHMLKDSFYAKNATNNKKKLPDEFYINARAITRKNNIQFGISIAEPNKIDFCEQIDVDFYKILSKDMLNKKLLEKIMETKKKFFVSTGVYGITEITKLMDITSGSHKKMSLIHTQLTSEIDLVNLKAIPMLQKKFKIPVAFGNHSKNFRTTILSLAFNPSDIFFYVKGNKTKKHPDHVHAVSFSDLKQLINDLQNLPRTIGNATKFKIPFNNY